MVALLLSFVAVGVQSPPPPWDEFVNDYQELGLPIPPAGASIIYYKTESGSGSGGSYEVLDSAVAVISSDKKRMTKIGESRPTDEAELSQWTVLPPTKEAVDDIRRRIGHQGHLTGDPLFPFQAILLGQGDVANLFRISNRYGSAFRNSRERYPFDRRELLVQAAIQHWKRAFALESSDRQPIVERLERMLQPKWGVNTPAVRNLVVDMKKTLEVRPPPANPHHAAIERLLDLHFEAVAWHDLKRQQADGWQPHTSNDRVEDERCQTLIRAGVAAVPALLEHRQDFRLTRSIYQHHREPLSTRNIRVADVVAMILHRMAPDEAFAYTMHEREGRGAEIDQAHVLAWVGRMAAKGERDAAVAGVFPKNNARAPVRVDQLRILAEKFPAEFPKAFRRAIRIASDATVKEDVLSVVRESKLPQAEKIAILREAIEGTQRVTRAQATAALARLDRAVGLPIFVEELKVAEDAPFGYEIHVLTLLVAELDDMRYWAALETAAKRFSADVRVGILTGLAARGRNPGAIPFWEKFLDDKARGEYRGPCSGDQLVVHVVQNLAAEKIAAALGWEFTAPTNPAGWSEFRVKIRAELDRRKREGGK